MPIRGDRLRWPPRPGKRSGAALYAARRFASNRERSDNIEQPPDSTNESGQSGNTPAPSSFEAARPPCDVETANGVDEKLIRDD